jgi:anti-sigma regulatory factor (Ser/Thr protein kinase)
MCCEHVLSTGRPLDAGEVDAERHLPLEPIPAAVGSARRFVLSALADLGSDDVDCAVLLTSELVTNAVLHARTPLCVGVTVADRRALICVADLVTDAPQPRPHSTTRLGGRGLALVGELAEDWGAVTTEAGKVVWFTIPIAVAARKVG